MLTRFFIKFSYVGTRYSGVAKQLNESKTVHNVIEESLKRNAKSRYSLKTPIYISSRTDAGVHALGNTGCFDLEVNGDSGLADSLQNSINQDLIRNGHLIRVLKCCQVENTFVARHALSRTYLYRLALNLNGIEYVKEIERVKKIEMKLNPGSMNSDLYGYMFPIGNYLSPLDKHYITELKEPFNKKLFMETIKVLNGEHDFSAFTTHQGRVEMIKKNKSPMKNVKIDVFWDNKEFMPHEMSEKYQIIEIEVKSSSFLYRMVRKTIGAAVDVARGRISVDKVRSMLDEPSKHYDDNTSLILNPNGLYLKNVEYEQQNLN